MRKRKSLLLIISMVLLVCACGKSEVPSQKEDAEEVVQENATTATEDAIEQNNVESTPEPTEEPTPEPTPKPIVYEGIDMESTLPGVEWSKTFDGIITEPKYFIFNDSTNKKVIVEQGQEIEFQRDDSLGIYIPEGEVDLGQIDKKTVFIGQVPGRPIIMSEIFAGYKNKDKAVFETDITFNGEEITLTATLILK